MKKATTILTCILLATAALLATGCKKKEESADEKHNYLEQWSNNELYHWHDCADKTCSSVTDKAEHIWEESGTITRLPSASQDGSMQYACTVCGRLRTETITFTGYSDEEWNKLIKLSKYENYSLKQIVQRPFVNPDGSVTQDAYYYTDYDFSDDKARYSKYRIIDGGTESEDSLTLSGDDARELRDTYNEFIAKILTAAAGSEFDPESRLYCMKTDVQISVSNKDDATVLIIRDLKILFTLRGIDTLSFSYDKIAEDGTTIPTNVTFMISCIGEVSIDS